MRKKAKRRQTILHIAGQLFNQNGFDATTMADIAAAADISPPTVFNYFGSKDNILSALLFEGTARERIQHLAQPRQTGLPFANILGDLFCEITENTMRIAGKRVWRYAESANIRRPNSEFQREFAASDRELLRLIRIYLTDYEIKLHTGAPPDYDFLAQLMYDRWSARYFDFIKDDDMALEDHFALLREDAQSLVALLFDESFAETASLKPAERAI
ncbi:TetR/AcrR family transcriptional regulator [Aestuariivita boseongensis]|uniref:TetR/AcrR family transcriptional regulator n=1 Tax=Aestuariivita boseongensis TaxID=1470562 RepID=UPI000682C3A1|nr:TetR/AcrR family transcriptional regulator [Aestuariivita boseongensis]